MIATLVSAALLGSPVAGPAFVQTPFPPEGLRWLVVSELNRAFEDLDDPTNRPPLITVPPEGVIVPVEIDHDGVTDWMVRWPGDSRWCGTGGCRVTLYASRDGGLRRVFDRQAVDGLRLSGEAGTGRVEGEFHPLLCRDTNGPCHLTWTIEAGDDELLISGANTRDAPAADVGPIDDTWRDRD